MKLRIKAMFNSIDGEVNCFEGAGQFSTFIRFAGCSLGCKYCDTVYAQDKDSGELLSVDEIWRRVERMGCNKITITGGEPLEQNEGLFELLYTRPFCHDISIETNGAHHIEQYDGFKNVRFVMDYKLPSSGVYDKMINKNLELLEPEDYVKFVIQDFHDYKIAKGLLPWIEAKIAFAPVWGKLDPRKLVEWIQKDKLYNVHLNVQLHKYIWSECVNSEIEK